MVGPDHVRPHRPWKETWTNVKCDGKSLESFIKESDPIHVHPVSPTWLREAPTFVTPFLNLLSPACS